MTELGDWRQPEYKMTVKGPIFPNSRPLSLPLALLLLHLHPTAVLPPSFLAPPFFSLRETSSGLSDGGDTHKSSPAAAAARGKEGREGAVWLSPPRLLRDVHPAAPHESAARHSRDDDDGGDDDVASLVSFSLTAPHRGMDNCWEKRQTVAKMPPGIPRLGNI